MMTAPPRFSAALTLALRALTAAVVGATGSALAACNGDGAATSAGETSGSCDETIVDYTLLVSAGPTIGAIDARDLAIDSGGALIAIGAGGVILREVDGGGPWAPIASGVTVDLRSIELRGAVGVIVGDGGTILRSGDGGKSWTPASSPTVTDLRDVFIVDDAVAIAIGGAEILRSTDGGKSWAPVAWMPPPGPLHLRVIGAGDHDPYIHVYAEEGPWIISNDGASWSESVIGELAIREYSRRYGYLINAGGEIHYPGCEGATIGAATAAVDASGRWIAGVDGQIHFVGLAVEDAPTGCETPILLASSASGTSAAIVAIVAIDDEHAVAITSDGGFLDLTVESMSHVETVSCPYITAEGRPLIVDERARVAPILARGGWAPATPLADLDALAPADRRRLADAWAGAGAQEHASIAAFARVVLELLALAAPAALIDATQAALADEINHARRCFAVASALAGRPLGPGPLAIDGALDGPVDLATFAVATFREGCVSETIAAAVAQVAAATCEIAALGETLAGIAEDEARHAALAWRTLAWALDAGGEPVRAALRQALRGLGDGRPGAVDDPAAAACPPGHGHLGPAEREAIAAATLRSLIIPQARALLYRGADGRPSPCEVESWS